MAGFEPKTAQNAMFSMPSAWLSPLKRLLDLGRRKLEKLLEQLEPLGRVA